jgi:hypothetical protein
VGTRRRCDRERGDGRHGRTRDHYRAEGGAAPTTFLALPALASAKVAPYYAMQAQGVGKVALGKRLDVAKLASISNETARPVGVFSQSPIPVYEMSNWLLFYS